MAPGWGQKISLGMVVRSLKGRNYPQYNRDCLLTDRGTLSYKVPHTIAQWSFSLTSRLKVSLADSLWFNEGDDLNSLSSIRLIFSFD